jgi:hypothetical protein
VRLEGLYDFAIVSTEFNQGSRLLLENVHDRIDRRTIFELPSERTVDQFHPRLFLIALQGGIEEQPNPIVHPEGSLILGAEEI